MSERRRSYRLPSSGGVTYDVDAYLAEWDALSAKVKRFFPDYEVVAFDPSLRFEKYGVNGLGARIVVDSFTLSVSAIEALTTPVACSRCGSHDDDVTRAPCPYAHDVEGDDTPVLLCEHCRQIRADDI